MAVIKPVGMFFDVASNAVVVLPAGSIPDSGEFGTSFIEASQVATNTDFATMDNYSPASPRLGLHLTDNVTDHAYFIFTCAHGIVSADNTLVGVMQIRDDTGAVTGTTPSAVSASTGLDMRTMDAGTSTSNVHWNMGRAAVSTASREAEWGLWFVEGGNIATFTMVGACMIVIPAQNTPLNTDATYAGSHLLATKTYRGFPGNLDPVGITAGDTDNPSAGVDMTISDAGEYLIFHSVRVEGGNFADNVGQTSIRWTLTDDDVDVFGVKTGVATSGAVRTGAGFQHNSLFLSGANKVRQNYASFVVRNLTATTHNWKLVGNKWDNGNDGTDRILHDGVIAIKTEQFDSFAYREDLTATTVDFDTMADWNEGVTVTGDGVKEFWVAFSTTLHTETAGTGLEYQFMANDVRIDTEVHAKHNIWATGDGADGAADSDNCLLPVCYWIAHTPAVGAVTYKIQVRRVGGGNTCIINCNDNGAAGFKGTMFAAGLSIRPDF